MRPRPELPQSGLHIIDEAFVRVHINLLGVPGAKLEDVTEAHSHLVLLPQCATFLTQHNIRGRVNADNARAARDFTPTTWPSPETRWPTFTRVTSLPMASTTPEYSWPTTIGVGTFAAAQSSQL